MRLGRLALFSFVAPGCTPSEDGSSALESASTSGGTTSGTEGSEAGSSTEPTTEPAATGTTDATADETGSANTTDSGTTGDPSGIECESRCADQAACGPDAELNCLTNCIDTQAAADWVGEACGAAYLTFQDCQTLRTCEQINQGTGCETELDGIAEACGPLAPEGCQAVCPRWIDCGLEDPTFCTANCALSQGLAALQAGQGCADAIDTTHVCEADLDCDTDRTQACGDELAAADKACG